MNFLKIEHLLYIAVKTKKKRSQKIIDQHKGRLKNLNAKMFLLSKIIISLHVAIKWTSVRKFLNDKEYLLKY